VLEVERLCRTRWFRPVKLTSATEGEYPPYSAMPSPARPSFSAAGRDRSSELLSLEESFRRYGLILSGFDEVAVGIGRVGSFQGSS
jgi:hypothetical protein